jgi:N12 class adenine-specific DNA methylase
MARIATGNYDAVIVSHRSFEFLPVSDAVFQPLRRKAGGGTRCRNRPRERFQRDDNRRIVKELEKARKRLIVRLKKRADRESKDRTLTFEELGVDQLFVDEADLYKNLAYVTKMNRIAGLPNSDSNRAFDMFLKIRYLQERSEGRGVVFATGTPISNTLAEMYTMLRYLGAGDAGRTQRRALRFVGGKLCGSRDIARTCPGRIGIPDAHAVRQIHQPAGIAFCVPHRGRRANGGYAEPPSPGT